MRASLVSLLVVAACSSSTAPADDWRMRDGFAEVELTFAKPVELADVRRALAARAPKLEVRRAGAGVVVSLPLDDQAVAKQAALVALHQAAGDAITETRWAGDRLYVRTTRPISEDTIRAAFESAGLGLTSVDLAADRFIAHRSGPDRAVERELETALGLDATVVRFESVGPQRRREAR